MLKKKKKQKSQKGSSTLSRKKKAPARKNPGTAKRTQAGKRTKAKKVGKVKKVAKKIRTGEKKSSAKKSAAVKKSAEVKGKSVANVRRTVETSPPQKVKPPAVLPAGTKRRSTLSPSREEALRRMLLEKKEEVWKDIKQKLFVQMGKEYREEVDVSLDDGDKAMVDLAAETGISLLDMRTDVLGKIDRALAKLDEGTYGICEDCGAEIHENRLKVVPFAIYCIDCKSKREEMESIAKETDRFAQAGPEEPE